jgi:predicted Rossmann-fold nucleotide-binding protein
MKGAAIGHVKQRQADARYIGLTEPGIIAAEPPNPMVNHLVVLPDIEKRLEAFVRMGHGIVVFPGGVGTAEEVLYLLGVLTDPANADRSTRHLHGSRSSADYFESLDHLITVALGEDVRRLYRIVINDAPGAAQWIGTQDPQGAGPASHVRRRVLLQLAVEGARSHRRCRFTSRTRASPNCGCGATCRGTNSR